MNGTSWTNPRFATNDNVALVASFNRTNRSRESSRFERTQPISREFDKAMRQNTARFI